MKITKQLLSEMIKEEAKKVLAEQADEARHEFYGQALDMKRSKRYLLRAKKVLETKPEMVNIVSNIDRVMLMLDTIYEMIFTPTNYNQENAQKLGLLPPKKQ